MSEQKTLHVDAAYWDRGWRNVPDMTGARRLLDAPDLREIAAALVIELPLRDVLDVGCGTGRAAQVCTSYVGTDIAPSAIEYCERKKIPAMLMTGSHDLPPGQFQTVLCISVFTHMGRDERRAYLAAFARKADELIADIIIGDGTGDVAVWTAVREEFEADLREAGYVHSHPVDFQWDDHVHSYCFAEQVA